MPKTKEKKCDVSKLKAGDIFSRVSHGRVVSVTRNPLRSRVDVKVENEDGFGWTVDANIVEEEFYTTDQFGEEVPLTRTELAAKVSASTRLNITVNFNKKLEPKDLVDWVDAKRSTGELAEMSRRKLSSEIRKVAGGEERTMIGRHDGVKDVDGRKLIRPLITLNAKRHGSDVTISADSAELRFDATAGGLTFVLRSQSLA